MRIGGVITALAPHLLDGFKKGLQYDADAERILVYAIKSGDTELIADVVAIAEQNLLEVVDTFGVVRQDVMKGFADGIDPFATSRHMTQALETKHGFVRDAKGHLILPTPPKAAI